MVISSGYHYYRSRLEGACEYEVWKGMRYSSFCIKVKVFGTISKEESFSMLEINFEIELSMISFFFPFLFCIFYIWIICTILFVQTCTRTKETTDIDYLIRALYFIYLSYLSFVAHIEIFINFKSFTKEAYSQHSQTSNNSKLLFRTRAMMLWKS